MKHSVIRGIAFSVVVCGLLAGSFFAGRLLAGPKAVQARTDPDSITPASIDASYGCHINNVAAFDNRIHVRCNEYANIPPGYNINYFAYPIGGANGYTASRMLAVAQTAGVLGKGVVIFFDSDYGSNPPGCNPSDCRLLTGISMVGLP